MCVCVLVMYEVKEECEVCFGFLGCGEECRHLRRKPYARACFVLCVFVGAAFHGGGAHVLL